MKCPSSLFCKHHNRKEDTIMHLSHAVGTPEQRQMPTFCPSDTFQTSVLSQLCRQDLCAAPLIGREFKNSTKTSHLQWEIQPNQTKFTQPEI